MNCFLLLSFLCAMPLLTMAQASDLRIGVSDRHPQTAVLISPVTGRFSVVSSQGDTLYRFRSDDVLSAMAVGDSVELRGVYGLNVRVLGAAVVGLGQQPSFLVKRGTDGKELHYPGGISVTAIEGKLILVNTVDPDSYVGHVVQAEVGKSAHTEYYKIQSIICRTYAVGNRGRHASDGFDLCDHQHCQVYPGAGSPVEAVAKATAATSGIVLADNADRPILAAFHANCGGQTANSQDVWAEGRPYLVSVPDTFCLSERSATWTERIDRNSMLQQFGADADTILTDDFEWNMEDRQAFIVIGRERVRTADLRRDLRLRSAYFDLRVEGDEVLFSGKGFGHGVGLCQQGAMRMAKEGFGYSEILGHYYTGAALVNMTTLK